MQLCDPLKRTQQQHPTSLADQNSQEQHKRDDPDQTLMPADWP